MNLDQIDGKDALTGTYGGSRGNCNNASGGQKRKTRTKKVPAPEKGKGRKCAPVWEAGRQLRLINIVRRHKQKKLYVDSLRGKRR